MSFVLRRADDVAFRWDRELLIGLHDRALAGNGGGGWAIPHRPRLRRGRSQRRPRVSATARRSGARPRRRRLCGHAGETGASCRLRRLDPRDPGGHSPVPGWQRPGRESGRFAGDVPRRFPARRSSPRSRNGGDGTCPTTTRHSGASAVRSMRLSIATPPSSEPTSMLNPPGAGPRPPGSASSGRSGWPWRRRWPRPTSPPGGQRGLGCLLRTERDAAVLPAARRRQPRDRDERSRGGSRGRPAAGGGSGPIADVSRRGGTHLRIGAVLGVPVDAPGDASRAAIIGELTRRAASEGPR